VERLSGQDSEEP